MNQAQKNILKQFSPEIQSHIVEFCKELTAIKCDVFVLFARKAACFITVLEEVGLLKLNGKVVSERVLDYETDWLKDKNIVLIDDTIISGTAVYKVIQSLEKIGVKQVSVRVFCINDFWFVKELFEKPDGSSYLQKPYLRLDHTTSLKFCKDIVKAFSIYPRPYSTDFPIFGKVKLTMNEFDKLQTLANWKVVDTTSNLQLENEVRCFSMNPKKVIFKGFFDELGIHLKDYCYLKLRVYSLKFPNENNRPYYYCRFLPLFIFEPVSDDLLDKLVAAVCQAEGADFAAISKILVTSIAKLRFVQFYFAQRFFAYVARTFQAEFGKPIKFTPVAREQDLIFPPDLISIISAFKFEHQLLLADSQLEGKFLEDPVLTEAVTAPINPLSIKDHLLFKFLEIYHKKELNARRKVKLFKKEAFEKPQFKAELGRLEEGYTFGQLKGFIAHKLPLPSDQNLVLSNFLDNAIDSGIIVPVTLHEDGFTSRGYRHGEEVIWGENNDKLMAVFYEKFLSKTEASDFSKFWFEKLLVLFLKMGIKGGALDEYNYLTAPPQATSLLGVRSYLYGQVTVFYELKPGHETKFNPILDYETKGHWASQRLIDLDILTLNKSERYDLDFNHLYDLHAQSGMESGEPSDLDDDLTGIVEEIAELLAIVRNYKQLDAKGLVLMTSCLSIHDCISSIAAEVYIFHQQIEQVINSVKSAVVKPSLYQIDFLKNLRSSSKNYSWTAINSGTDKYLDYMNGEGEALVRKISKFFANIDSFKKRSWDKYWKKEIEHDTNDAPDLHALNNDLGGTLIEINVTLLYLQSLIYQQLVIKGQVNEHIAELQEQQVQLGQQADRHSEAIKELSDKAIPGNQAAIDFKNAEKLRTLEVELKSLKLKGLSIREDILYWTGYIADNAARTAGYFQEYVKTKPVPASFNDAVVEMNGIAAITSEAELSQRITAKLEQLAAYKDKADFLLSNFSSLVPQWGKINPIIKYDGLIHINTRSKDPADRARLGLLIRKELADFELQEFTSDTELAKSFVLLRPLQHMEHSGYFIGLRGASRIDRFTRLAARLLQACDQLPMDFNLYYFPQLEDQFVLKAYYNKQTKIYDEIHEDFRPYFSAFEKPTEKFGRSLIIFPSRRLDNPEIFKRTIQETIKKSLILNRLKSKYPDGNANDLYHMEIDKQTSLSAGIPAKAAEKYIGVVTALPKEFAAVKVVLENIVPNFKGPADDPNDYAKALVTARSGEKIHVIIALAKEMGTNAAASATAHMLRSFTEIKDVIISGIAGGIPHPSDASEHVRLGDIVVSYKNGVLQYDNIKDADDFITIRSSTSRPSAKLSGYCNVLESERMIRLTPWNTYITKHEKALLSSKRPAAEKDKLRIAGVATEHPHDPEREAGVPKVYFGPIGSANTLLKNEKKRDYLRDTYKVKAVEMEGSGIADGTWHLGKGYLVVRGICDYANEDKNNDWQDYAAIIAAAYTRSIIELM